MYEGIVKRLRRYVEIERAEHHGADLEAEAADAIEFFSNRLCDACGVCPTDKRNPFNCEIAGTDHE